VFSIVTYTPARSRRGTIARKGHFVPRVPVRAAGAARAAGVALVAAGVAASGLMYGGAASAAVATGAGAMGARPGHHSNPPPAYARTLTVRRLSDAGPGSLRAAITSANTSLPAVPHSSGSRSAAPSPCPATCPRYPGG
jgi:hypothetical protein